MITAGELPVGTRLPTVRELSRRLGVSPTTVSEAWRRLADVGAIEARGRNGTFVRQPTGPGRAAPLPPDHRGPGPLRARPVVGHARPDAAARPRPDRRPGRQAVADVELPRPPGAPGARGRAAARRGRSRPRRSPSSTARWTPSTASPRSCCASATGSSSSTPAFPPLLDLLDQLGCDVVGVDVDDEGLDVDGLRAALADGRAGAVFLQPRAQNPAGVAMSPTPGRRRSPTCSRPTDAIVVEDDHANDISVGAAASASARGCPTRTVHIRSFSKSHGPDLRLAAVGGAGDVVTAVANRRLLGPGWSSRILQARAARAAPRPGDAGDDGRGPRAPTPSGGALVSDVLAAHGVDVTGTDGINLWMARRRRALGGRRPRRPRASASRPASPFLVRPDDDHLRVTVGLLAGPDDHVARSPSTSPPPPAGPRPRQPPPLTASASVGHGVPPSPDPTRRPPEVRADRAPTSIDARLFTAGLGFRLDMIMPADRPRTAVVRPRAVLDWNGRRRMAGPPPVTSDELRQRHGPTVEAPNGTSSSSPSRAGAGRAPWPPASS